MPLYFPTASSSSSGEGASVEGRREERKSKQACRRDKATVTRGRGEERKSRRGSVDGGKHRKFL